MTERRSPALAPLVAVTIVGGLVVGAATSIGQGFLPEGLGPLANSAGAWSLAAFLLALVNRDPFRGAALGAIALVAMVIGYVVLTEVRGYTAGLRLFVFWGLAAVVVGPAIGIGAAWVRGTDPWRIAMGAAVIAGILVGEGAFGLTVNAATTPASYWTVQVLLGVGIVLAAWARLRDVVPAAVCLALTSGTAAALYLVYGANLMALL